MPRVAGHPHPLAHPMNRMVTSALKLGFLLAFALWGCSAKPNAEPSKTVAQAEHLKTISDLEKMGGKAVVDETSPDKPVISVNFNGSRATDAGLVHLKRLPKLRALDLSWSAVSDAGLENLAGLTRLQSLNLTATRVTDAGLVHFATLTSLHSLNLAGTQVSDTGLEYLKGLSALQSLNLMGTNITEAGIRGLQETIPNCAVLH